MLNTKPLLLIGAALMTANVAGCGKDNLSAMSVDALNHHVGYCMAYMVSFNLDSDRKDRLLTAYNDPRRDERTDAAFKEYGVIMLTEGLPKATEEGKKSCAAFGIDGFHKKAS